MEIYRRIKKETSFLLLQTIKRHVSVTALQPAKAPQADDCWAIDPVIKTQILAEFACVEGVLNFISTIYFICSQQRLVMLM